MKYIKLFENLTINDIPLVGGKNASLGQMIANLTKKNILIPTGFAVTAQAYDYYIQHNQFNEKIKTIFQELKDHLNIEQLEKAGSSVRSLILSGEIPDDLAQEITRAYDNLCKKYNQNDCDVAVRSSATAEDLPNASFAGQQETYLNITGHKNLLEAYKKALASLFTNRAIVYRTEKGFDHFQVALSVGVQKMIRSDLASSGVAFSLDTESGFKDAIIINSAYGLGESIVKGEVIPDEFVIHKPTLAQGFTSIIKKNIGEKKIKIIYTNDTDNPTETIETTKQEQQSFSLKNEEIIELAKAIATIEDYYTNLKGTWCPMDIEWAKDGKDNKLYIIQARPETVHTTKKMNILTKYHLIKNNVANNKIETILEGQSIGQQIVSGIARIIKDPTEIKSVKDGDIIITQMTDPDWVPIMKKAGAIITDHGGRTCHAAIVSRELGIPALVGTANATKTIENESTITLDCSQGTTGFVYKGAIPFEKKEIEIQNISTNDVPTKIMINIADPERAFTLSMLPNDGVGLARLEFIINNNIKIHPLALLKPEKITDASIKKFIEDITQGYKDKKQFFIDKLAHSIGMIAAAFYPKPVIVRLSDFKTNEYRNLIGGTYFEPHEENPMLGYRGASRYYSNEYKEAFILECQALQKVREKMGLTNVKVMVPFVRTVKEGKKVLQIMENQGLEKGKNNLEIIMMCEIPSNVILINEFSKLFDGFSIGSNDLTQLTLGVDRDSGLLAHIFDERDMAVKKMFELAITGAHKNKKYIGICGQGPSDFPEIAQLLIKLSIDSLSLNQDSIIEFIKNYKK